MHDEFIQPTKKHADIIVPKGGNNTVALHMIIDRVNAILHRTKISRLNIFRISNHSYLILKIHPVSE